MIANPTILIPYNFAAMIQYVRGEERTKFWVSSAQAAARPARNYGCYQDWLCVSSLRLICVKLRTMSTSNGESGKLNANSHSALG